MQRKKVLFFVGVGFVILVLACPIVSPVFWNATVNWAGLSMLKTEEPYIQFGMCRVYDGETVTYTDGIWKTSSECTTRAGQFLDRKSIEITNSSAYSFDVSKTSDETEMRIGESFLKVGGEALWGVTFAPNSANTLMLNSAVGDFIVEFLPGIPEYSR